jgi:hypothetical protein
VGKLNYYFEERGNLTMFLLWHLGLNETIILNWNSYISIVIMWTETLILLTVLLQQIINGLSANVRTVFSIKVGECIG